MVLSRSVSAAEITFVTIEQAEVCIYIWLMQADVSLFLVLYLHLLCLRENS